MVTFDVGPASDFGSLSAFLGVASHGNRNRSNGVLGVQGAKDVASKDRTADCTLNKKVAFRMLKQLGCEVRPEANDTNFVEVSLAKQPVLFKMLVELGHGPIRNEEGTMVVRVQEQRPRRPEEVVAALSAPRKSKTPEEEGYPSIGLRPRLKPEDEEQLVKRLYAPKSVPKDLPEKSTSKPRRTATEQRAYLDRLLKPRECADVSGPEDLKLEIGMGLTGPQHSSNRLEWPKFSSPSARLAKPKVDRKGLAGLSKGNGHNGPLVQAGQLLLSESPVRHLEEPLAEGFEEQVVEAEFLDHEHESIESRESPKSDLNPSEAKDVKEGNQGDDDVDSEPLDPLDRLDRLDRLDPESFAVAVDRLLGSAPKLQKRSAQEQQLHAERLSALAQPRKKAPTETKTAEMKRSPRSQREACNRLAQPRLKAPHEPSHASNAATNPSTNAASNAGRVVDTDIVEDELEEEEVEAEEVVVQVIPSMLAQCSLERIDEEGSRAARARRRQRTPGAAGPVGPTPYLATMSLSKRERPEKQGLKRTDTERKQADLQSGPRLAFVAEDGAQDESMLHDIDALYSQLIKPVDDTNDFVGPVSQPSDPGNPTSLLAKKTPEAPDIDEEVYETETPEVIAEPAHLSNLKDEDLLATIDQLFHEMIQGNGSDAMPSGNCNWDNLGSGDVDRKAGQVDMSSDSTHPEKLKVPTASKEGESGGSAALDLDTANDDLEIPMLLEEVLWSALLIARRGHSAVVSELPVLQLKVAASLCPLPCSLRQRLAAELPELSLALASEAGGGGPGGPGGPCPDGLVRDLQEKRIVAGSLRETLRKTRDALLGLASQSSEEASQDKRPVKMQKGPKRQKRRTSLSYWTEESLEQLEAPKAAMSFSKAAPSA